MAQAEGARCRAASALSRARRGHPARGTQVAVRAAVTAAAAITAAAAAAVAAAVAAAAAAAASGALQLHRLRPVVSARGRDVGVPLHR